MHIGNKAIEFDFFTGLDDWMDAAIARCQRFAGEIAVADHDEGRARVQALARSIAQPPSRAHNLILAPLLLDTALRIAEYWHREAAGSECACWTVSPATIRAFLNWKEQNSIHVFSTWTKEFFDAYDRHHPATASDRLANLLRKQPARPWTMATLARTAGVSTRGLARAFRRSYGETLRAYLHLCRMHAMLAAWSSNVKIEALALEVGYRSRKDFYRVLRQTMQMTPALLRRLSPDERAHWQRHLKARLKSGRRIEKP